MKDRSPSGVRGAFFSAIANRSQTFIAARQSFQSLRADLAIDLAASKSHSGLRCFRSFLTSGIAALVPRWMLAVSRSHAIEQPLLVELARKFGERDLGAVRREAANEPRAVYLESYIGHAERPIQDLGVKDLRRVAMVDPVGGRRHERFAFAGDESAVERVMATKR